MNTHFFKICSLIALGSLAFSCVDDNYDFSDIDKTVQVKINNLTVPVNVETIELKSIIDIDDDDEHIKIIDNEYAYVTEGTFHSNAININPITFGAPSIKPTHVEISAKNLPLSVSQKRLFGVDNIEYTFTQGASTSLDLNAENISKDLMALKKVYGNATFRLDLSISELHKIAKEIKMSNLKFHLPKGLIMTQKAGQNIGSYNPSTGEFLINNYTLNLKDGLHIEFDVTGIELSDTNFDKATHSIAYAEEISIIEGTFNLPTTRENLSAGSIASLQDLPKKIELNVNYTLGDILIKKVSGAIRHELEGINIDPVSLNDLPDVLTQDGTNLIIDNPKIYVGISNDILNLYNIQAQAQANIIPYKDGKERNNCQSDMFVIGGKKQTPEMYGGKSYYNICLSPKKENTDFTEYANADWFQYASLSRVLSGNGLPSSLHIELLNTEIPEQSIDEFELRNYGGVDGRYKLIAPLKLEAGSCISYSDKMDGWSDDDFDKLTITAIEINMEITTDVPFAIDFTGYPIDKNGNRINGIEINGAKINANANAQKVSIYTTKDKELKNLDGIEFVAKASAESGKALSPNMHIKLSNIRPTVSGYYQDEL